MCSPSVSRSLEPLRRIATVSPLSRMSPTACTAAATATASNTPPKDSARSASPKAHTPANAPMRARDEVQTIHLVYGRPNSPTSEHALTIIAAIGPKTTAAKRMGSTEIDISVFAPIATHCRSARKATPARRATIHHAAAGGPSLSIKTTHVTNAPAARQTAYASTRRDLAAMAG
jgi:hypothetical protein